jgi:hypothetical protein
VVAAAAAVLLNVLNHDCCCTLQGYPVAALDADVRDVRRHNAQMFVVGAIADDSGKVTVVVNVKSILRSCHGRHLGNIMEAFWPSLVSH